MIIDRTFTYEERIEISSLLSNYHTVFQTFWTVGKPIFTHSIKTAAVGFDNQGKTLYMIINPDFWDSLDIINKAFVISHECLHIILKHGSRGNGYKNQDDVNRAMDIVINEMLVLSFGFNKFSIQNWEKYCFVETMFTKEDIINYDIHTRGSFTYYLDLMAKTNPNEEPQTVDQHGNSFGQGSSGDSEDGSSSEKIDPAIQEYIDQAQEFASEAIDTLREEFEPNMDDKEKYDFGQKLGEDLKDTSAGTNPLGSYININPFKPKKKKKWEEIVKKHLKSVMKFESVDRPSWITRDRRHACLDEELFVQGVWPEERPVRERYKIIFFLDTSGSCFSYAQRFVKMLQTIPEETFEIEAYAFDCALYPIDLKTGKVRGGGGTYFHILDNKIREITAKKRHPDAVFVLSDGDGNRFSPEKPKLWHWILTPRHSLTYIPKDSPKHNMANFE